MTGDSVVKAIILLFLIAISPFLLGAVFLLCWLGASVALHG